MKPIITFTTTRRDGNARDPARLARILRFRGLPRTIATGEQVHGHHLAVVPKLRQTRRIRGVDGLLTAAADQPLGIYTADCAAIFLSAPSYGVVGLLHAGWRGVQGGILKKALAVLRRRWNCPARQVQIEVGPCIGPCCFEVRWDVARYFPATRRRKETRWVVDLQGELKRQARRFGIRVLRTAAPCTRHHSTFFSYRRDKTDKRQISVIMRASASRD